MYQARLGALEYTSSKNHSENTSSKNLRHLQARDEALLGALEVLVLSLAQHLASLLLASLLLTLLLPLVPAGSR
jgi:hypothetical protein